MYSKRRPTYSLSQNFLHNPQLIQRLVGFAELNPNDNVLEIGAGSGQITPYIWNQVHTQGSLTALEIDPRLYAQLTAKFRPHPRLNLLNLDFECFDLTSLPTNYVVVSNLPFQLTSYALTQLLEIRTPVCLACHVVVQQEAAYMFGGTKLRKPETKKSVIYAPFYSFEIKYLFNPYDFKPAPQVKTVFLCIHKINQPLIDPQHFMLWKEFISVLSQDRVGHGTWQQLFSRESLQLIKRNYSFKWNAGISFQSWKYYLKVFNNLILTDADMMLKLYHYSQHQLKD